MTTGTTHGITSPKFPPAQFPVLFILAFLIVSCTCQEPTDKANTFRITSGPTEVRLSLQPFDWQVHGDDGSVGASSSERGCPPLSLAIRPDDDLGDLYHFPENPGEDLVWYHSDHAKLLSEQPLTLEVTLKNPTGRSAKKATVQASVGAHGFVQLLVEFAGQHRDIAMATTCWSLQESEHVVGGGERFDGVDLVGRTIPINFQAPGPFESATNESHAPVPFITSSRGLALLVQSERPGAFDVGASDPQQLRARFHGSQLPLLLRAGSMVDNAAAHARLMGLPPPLPRWTMAPMQWRNELIVEVDNTGTVLSTGQDRILEDARQLRALNIPNTCLWIDAPWETGYNTFAFNSTQFPDPQQMLRDLEALGFRVIVWATDNINRSDDSDQMTGMPDFGSLELYEDFRDRDYLVTTADGEPFVFAWPRGSGGYVDFTNSDAGRAYTQLARPIVEWGIRGFKLDYGETMRPNLTMASTEDLMVFADGSTTQVMHTRHARLYHQAFLQLLQEVWPQDHFVISRTGGIYDQANGITIWPGDLDNDFSRSGVELPDGNLNVGGLPAAISAALSLAFSGYPFFASDIGGYRGGAPTGEVLLRWAQFEALTPIMQLGGGGGGDTTHNPWDPRYGTSAVDIYRRYARLHMDLLPTFAQLVARATLDGTPLIQPLGVFMENDSQAWSDQESFVLGERLLAAPVVEPGATQRMVRFPRGDWLSWWTNAQHTGPASETVEAPLETLPLFVKAGSIVWMGDPRLMTPVSAADDSVADQDSYGNSYLLRSSPGPSDRRVLVDGSVAVQQTTQNTTTINIDATSPRRITVDLRLRSNSGPSGQVVATVNEAQPAEVSSWDALWLQTENGGPAIWRNSDQLLVTAWGDTLEFTFTGNQ